MDFTFLAQADTVALQFERAKRALENAKADFEVARLDYDALLARADENGIPKAKLKKLAEDRVAALIESGVVDFPQGTVNKEAKKASKPRVSKNVQPKEEAEEIVEMIDHESVEFDSEDPVAMTAN